MNGADVLVQSAAADWCRGFRDVAVAQPVRMLRLEVGRPGSGADDHSDESEDRFRHGPLLRPV